jgi:FlaG/FlaF family flagellin (archaellin)
VAEGFGFAVTVVVVLAAVTTSFVVPGVPAEKFCSPL